MASNAGKGGARRPGTGYAEGADRIWPEPPKYCPGCGMLPSWCACTDDGPGQDEASQEVKTNYERRNFEGDL